MFSCNRCRWSGSEDQVERISLGMTQGCYCPRCASPVFLRGELNKEYRSPFQDDEPLKKDSREDKL